MTKFIPFLSHELFFFFNFLQVRVNCCIKLAPWSGGKSTHQELGILSLALEITNSLGLWANHFTSLDLPLVPTSLR